MVCTREGDVDPGEKIVQVNCTSSPQNIVCTHPHSRNAFLFRTQTGVRQDWGQCLSFYVSPLMPLGQFWILDTDP
jgi:hypothetical protein